jgi:glycosyltransferase involved in cell wall biosynthesis
VTDGFWSDLIGWGIPPIEPLTLRAVLFYAVAALHAGLLLTFAGNWLYLRRTSRPRREPQVWPSVTVLIPARNEERNLERLLPSLLAQDYPADAQFVVYDDGSTDGTSDVIARHADERLLHLRGNGPAPGWVGKVHALYQATRHATGERYLFLDADTDLIGPHALRRVVAQHEALPQPAVLTGLTGLARGGGRVLVSLVPNAILVGLPWFLVPVFRMRALGALNGQMWLIRSDLYRQHEPHLNHKAEVLEDVQIGRSLRMAGVVPYMADVQASVDVYMYGSFGEAWAGFRKNAYLILGGTPLAFALLWPYFVLTFALAPLLGWPLILSTLLVKATTDGLCRFPLWMTLLAPVSYTLGAALQLDSALAHWRGRVSWKGRRV